MQAFAQPQAIRHFSPASRTATPGSVTCATPSPAASHSASSAKTRRRPAIRRPRQPPPEPELINESRQISLLTPARKTLRKKLGVEPSIEDAISLTRETTPAPHPDFRCAIDARNQITVKWLWLVAAVARKAHITYIQGFPDMEAALSLSDIMQEGVCGLITSVEKWDPQRGYAFDAFAFYMIKHAILRAVENQARPIRLPVHVLNKLSKMRKIKDEMAAGGEDVELETVAHEAGVNIDEARLYVSRSKTTWSIDAPVDKRDKGPALSSPLREFLVDHSVDVARQVERECTREAVADLVHASSLGELERSVLSLKFGLGDGVERLRAEVSRILDVRVEKVRRAELSALKKLRSRLGDDASAWLELIN